jgi:hypothetical protein
MTNASFFIVAKILGQVWWYKPVISAIRRCPFEGLWFKASLGRKSTKTSSQ